MQFWIRDRLCWFWNFLLISKSTSDGVCLLQPVVSRGFLYQITVLAYIAQPRNKYPAISLFNLLKSGLVQFLFSCLIDQRYWHLALTDISGILILTVKACKTPKLEDCFLFMYFIYDIIYNFGMHDIQHLKPGFSWWQRHRI